MITKINKQISTEMSDLRATFVKSTTTPCSARDELNFSAPGGEWQKHVSALNGALATGWEAAGL
jgi:hypothetical protein